MAYRDTDEYRRLLAAQKDVLHVTPSCSVASGSTRKEGDHDPLSAAASHPLCDPPVPGDHRVLSPAPTEDRELLIYRRALDRLAHPNRSARKVFGDIEEAVTIAREAVEEVGDDAKDLVFVSADRKVLVNVWRDGTVTAALRVDPDHTWGPPVTLRREV
jgi:hypothetical protein